MQPHPPPRWYVFPVLSIQTITCEDHCPDVGRHLVIAVPVLLLQAPQQGREGPVVRAIWCACSNVVVHVLPHVDARVDDLAAVLAPRQKGQPAAEQLQS
eukprot:363093-Chlamydomonas_euryale.AAC.3